MESVVIVEPGVNLVKCQSLDQNLDDVMSRFKFNEFTRLPLIFNKDIPVIDEPGKENRSIVSTVGYHIITPSKTLIVTYEIQYFEEDRWDFICRREIESGKYSYESIPYFITNRKRLFDFISKSYIKCHDVAPQSLVKSARK